jgi:tagatose 6-phosphate kinase
MILCLGTTPTAQRTLIFERVTLDAVNRAAEVHEHASGKSVNVARVAHSLGEPVLATGFLGGDRGAFLRRELDRAGIAHDFVTVSPQTRLCTTVVDRSNKTATELVEESAAVGAGDWNRLAETFSSAVSRAKLCVLSGSLPPGGPAQFYADCVRIAQTAGCPVILDAGDALARSYPQAQSRGVGRHAGDPAFR